MDERLISSLNRLRVMVDNQSPPIIVLGVQRRFNLSQAGQWLNF
jgi:hypothetical protein